MSIKEFFSKITSPILWGNFLAMIIVLCLIALGVWIGLNKYTKHNIEIEVPSVKGMTTFEAFRCINDKGLEAVVADSSYDENLPVGAVLSQIPEAGRNVKPGRRIELTVNSSKQPTIAIPDIVDNSSLREAEAKLIAMGLEIAPCKRIDGERDWVYGIEYKGKKLYSGDRVPEGATVTLIAGNGYNNEFWNDSLQTDSIAYDETVTDINNESIYDNEQF